MLTHTQWYRHAHAKDMPIKAIARLIQTMLYAQRFFPYYVYNILSGIEEDGMYLFDRSYSVNNLIVYLTYRHWRCLLL
jgi:20S proteasome subunit beta 6